MQIKKKHRTIFQLTLSAYELASLITSARWIVDGAQGELNTDAINNLKQILANYDRAAKELHGNPSV